MSQHEEIARRIQRNWASVIEDVRSAAADSGRADDSVRVVGVSKYVDAPMTQLLVDAGCHDLGESRPQMLWQKAEQLGASDALRWHMIGHVQTNKLRRMMRFNPLIHSVDSERLLRAIDREARDHQRVVRVLLEVNISGDESKTGLSPEELRALIEMQELPGVEIAGLMAMAGWGTEPDQAASQFRDVAALRDDLVRSTGQELAELSMGMSGDFREAIAAGSTMVRIGSALFEGVR